MRILRIVPRSEPYGGGRERHVYRLTQLQAMDPDIQAVTLITAEPANRVEGADIIEVSPAPHRVSSVVASLLFAVRAFSASRRAPKVDLIHVHGDFIEAFLGILLGRARGIPVVLTFHGGLNRRLITLSRLAARLASAVIAVSPAIRESLMGGWPVLRRPIAVIPSGIEPELRCATRTRRGEGDVLEVCFVGSLIPMKGVDDLVAALARVPETRLRLRILGDGPCLSDLEASSDSRIEFYGYSARSTVNAVLLSSDVAVFASRDTVKAGEGTPTAMLEAMAAGCAILGCPVGGIPSVVRHGVNGFVLDTPTSESIAAYLELMASDPDLVRRMGVEARRAAAEFEWPAASARIRDVYRTVAGG